MTCDLKLDGDCLVLFVRELGGRPQFLQGYGLSPTGMTLKGLSRNASSLCSQGQFYTSAGSHSEDRCETNPAPISLMVGMSASVGMMHGVTELLIIQAQTIVVPLTQAIRKEVGMCPGARDR